MGKAKNSLKERQKAHQRNAVKGVDYFFYRAIRKYGWDSFEWEILEDSIPDTKMLSERERYHITRLRANNPNFGYNLTAGGDGEDTFSGLTSEQQEIRRQHCRDASTGRHALTPEGRERIRRHMIGDNPMKTKKGVIAMLASRVYTRGPDHPSYGRHLSEEQKKRLSEVRIGKKASEETRALRSLQTQGSNNPNASPVQCIETGEIFACIKDAQQKFGKILAISLACRKDRLAGGFHWKYAD